MQSADEWTSFMLSGLSGPAAAARSAAAGAGGGETETPPTLPAKVPDNKLALYALDTCISDQLSFNMFALHERFKDCAYIQDLHKQLNSVERKDDMERNGYKNRFMVALLSEQVKQLERELHEKTIVQKEQEKQMQLMHSVLQQVSPALQENERLKQVCADLVRMTEDKDAELKEEQKKRSRYLEDYQEQTKRIRIAIQEEVNAEHTKTITAVQQFSQGKLPQNDMLDQMIVFLEKARLMNRCTVLLCVCSISIQFLFQSFQAFEICLRHGLFAIFALGTEWRRLSSKR